MLLLLWACSLPSGVDPKPETPCALVWYRDRDGDGSGNPHFIEYACTQPVGGSASGDDCNDRDPAIHPGAEELCNSLDDDCDGAVDGEDTDGILYFLDADGDGVGTLPVWAATCDETPGLVAQEGDCDDSNPAVYPSAPEVCDGVDNDCDGQVDDDDSDLTGILIWYNDGDADGYGDPNDAFQSCIAPDEHVAYAGDCDDHDNDIYPGAPELINGFDDNCNGSIDENGSLWYQDVDGDGYGDPSTEVFTDNPASDWIVVGEDCDDSDSQNWPGAPEMEDGVDNDCDGLIDEDFGGTSQNATLLAVFSVTRASQLTIDEDQRLLLVNAYWGGSYTELYDLSTWMLVDTFPDASAANPILVDDINE